MADTESKRQVLRDILLLEASGLHVDTTKGGPMILDGIFQKGDEPNANRRIYPLEYLLREVERLKIACDQKSLVGELDHPYYPDESESAIVHSQNVSHAITKLWSEGNTIFGRLEVLDTPSGLILQEFIKKKVTIGVSSRALGAVREAPNGFNYVDETLKIITFDAVVGPSVVESKLKEAKHLREWLEVQSGILRETEAMKDKEDLEEMRYHIRKKMKDMGL